MGEGVKRRMGERVKRRMGEWVKRRMGEGDKIILKSEQVIRRNKKSAEKFLNAF